jgi:hypothetical protein
MAKDCFIAIPLQAKANVRSTPAVTDEEGFYVVVETIGKRQNNYDLSAGSATIKSD